MNATAAATRQALAELTSHAQLAEDNAKLMLSRLVVDPLAEAEVLVAVAKLNEQFLKHVGGPLATLAAEAEQPSLFNGETRT